MDENKLKKLMEIGYKIEPCCGFCIHRDMHPRSVWGVCRCWSYDHLKHTGLERELSISRFGHCQHFEADEHELRKLQGFKQFF